MDKPAPKCGKRCAERGCQRPRVHTAPGSKFCPPCVLLVSQNSPADNFCLRCQSLFYAWANRALKSEANHG